VLDLAGLHRRTANASAGAMGGKEASEDEDRGLPVNESSWFTTIFPEFQSLFSHHGASTRFDDNPPESAPRPEPFCGQGFRLNLSRRHDMPNSRNYT
jgi:hypothetical protein